MKIPTLIVTIGCSGSGKSRFSKKMKDDGYVIINPDDIRRELTGDVSDQSKNRQVWQTAHSRLRAVLDMGQDVVFDSTATNAKTRKELIKIARASNPETVTVAALIMDSKDLELCKSRVRKDLDTGVDRSNTLVVEGIIEKQHNGFMHSIKNVETEDFNLVIEA